MMLRNQDHEKLETIEEIDQRRERPTIPVPREQLTDAYLLAEWRRSKQERENQERAYYENNQSEEEQH